MHNPWHKLGRVLTSAKDSLDEGQQNAPKQILESFAALTATLLKFLSDLCKRAPVLFYAVELLLVLLLAVPGVWRGRCF